MDQRLVALKTSADEKVGTFKHRLNDCGPRGNRSVESALDYWQGRADALKDAILLEVAEVASRSGE